MTFITCNLPFKNFRNLALPCPAGCVTCPDLPWQGRAGQGRAGYP